MDKIISTNLTYDEYHDKLRARYGNDANIMGLSLLALLNDREFEPELAEPIRNACYEWYDSRDYWDYYTGNLEKKLLEIENSDRMKDLCHRISVHVYHREEGRNI